MADPDDVKAHHAQPLGRMVANFANLEMYVAWLAHLLISRDQIIGRIVTSKLSFANTTAVVAALARHKLKGPILEELLGLLKRASALEQKRNTLTHSVWTLPVEGEQDPDTVGRLKFKISTKKGYVEEVEDLPLKEIDAVSDGIGALMKDIMVWFDKAAAVDKELAHRIAQPLLLQ